MPEPPNIIILPGWGHSASVYVRLAARLRKLGLRPYVHTHLEARRGQPVQDYLRESEQDLQRVLMRLGVERYTILAYSFGALLAITHAVRPDATAIQKVVLLSPVGGPVGVFHPVRDVFHASTGYMPALANPSGWGTILRAMRAFIPLFFFHIDHLYQSGYYAATTDIRDEAKKIRIPLTLMASRADRTINFERARQLAAAVPHAHFVEVEGTHLWPFLLPKQLEAELQ